MQGLGTFELGGSTELPGPFTLLVSDGGTVNWLASTTLDGDFTIDTTQNATNGDERQLRNRRRDHRRRLHECRRR